MAKENLISLIEFDKDKGLDLTNLYDHLFCDIEKTKYGVDKKFKELEDDELENSIKVFLSTVTEYCKKNPNFGDNVIINQTVNPRAEEAFIKLIKNLQTELPKYNPELKYIIFDNISTDRLDATYIKTGIKVLDLPSSKISIKTRIMRIFYLELQKLNITDNAISSKEAEDLMKQVYEKSKKELGYEFNYSLVLESIQKITAFRDLSVPEINHNDQNLSLKEFVNIVLNEQEVHPEMYVNKKSDDLYFVFTKVTEANYHKWLSYGQYQDNYARNCPNGQVYSTLKENGQRAVLNNVGEGVTGFLKALHPYQEADVWVAYASREPVTDPNEVDLNKIEMAVTVSAANGKSQFTSHMGIMRSVSDLCTGEKGHKKLSIDIHAFGALIMSKLHPEADRMMNVPIPVMRSILVDEVFSTGKTGDQYILDDQMILKNSVDEKSKLDEEIKKLKPWYLDVVNNYDLDTRDIKKRYHELLLQKELLNQKRIYERRGFKPHVRVTINEEQKLFKDTPANIIELLDKEGKVIETIGYNEQEGKYKWFFDHPDQFRFRSTLRPLVSFSLEVLKEIAEFSPEIEYFATKEKLMLKERVRLDKQKFEIQKEIHTDKVMQFSQVLEQKSFKDAVQKMTEMHKKGPDKGGNGKQEENSPSI